MITELKIIEQYENVVAYDCGKVYYVEMKQGGIASDHTHAYKDIVLLMKGEVELTVGGTTQRIKAPKKIVIPPNVYHKFVALTDVIGVEAKTGLFSYFLNWVRRKKQA